MSNFIKNMIVGGSVASVLVIACDVCAQDYRPVTDASAFTFNTLLFLICGMVVMFMAAGFCMLEVGLVRSKNAATICLKNIALYSVAGIIVWLVGYNIIYNVPEGGIIAPFSKWFFWSGSDSFSIETGHAVHAEWFFQMVFVATAASIVSGALAERIKLWPFLIFVIFLTGLIYPIQASWQWGGGFLAQKGFYDFAGATLVHSTGGWAALAGVLILGPRVGKFSNNKVTPIPGSSLPLATLGTFILWFGWFGFNGGSQLAFGSVLDAIAVAKIFVNTNTAAAAGVLTAMILSSILYAKIDLTVALNGAIGGLVSITAGPLDPTIPVALGIGAVGGVIVTIAIPLLDNLRIDDVVGAIPAHLFCGIWGTMIVPFSSPGDSNYTTQALGIVMVGIFVFTISFLLWTTLNYTLGIRVSKEEEIAGLDKTELGQEAYPEFTSR